MKKQKTAQGLKLALRSKTGMQRDVHNESSWVLPGAAGRPQRGL